MKPAQFEKQEPVGKFAKFTDGIWREVTDGSAGIPLYTTPPPPLTLKQKAQERSISEMCNKKSKSKTTKGLCKRWKEQQNA